jgi:hypothetical protein
MRVAEINFDIEDPAHKSILEKGVAFADESIIIPCRACEQGSLAVHLELSNLPFTTEKNLSDGLCKSLSLYGDVLDVGTLVEATSDTYMCTGYAILDRSRRSGQFKPLTHAIPWTGGGTKNHFYAVWSDMGNYCPRCHSEDHTLDACPKADDDTLITSDHAMSENGLPEYVEYARQKTGEYINLVVSGEGNVTTTIKLKRVTPLYKLMHAYCKQRQKSPQNMCFLYHGQVLVHDKTPEDMHMEEGDTIHFVDNQRRGA